MINYITGTIDYIGNDFIVVENNGIGYNIYVSDLTIESISQKGDFIKIYIYMLIKDDSIKMYGFLSFDELNLFKLLTTISGVGSKGALSILSTLKPDEINLAIITGDLEAISRCRRIGKKIAQRIVLELKDKIETEYPLILKIDNDKKDKSSIEKNDAIEVLVNLGFGRGEAVKAVIDVTKNSSDDMSLEEIVKYALKLFSK